MPGGAPHGVENLTDTVAIGGNFVDESNFERVLAELAIIGSRYGDAQQLAEALGEVDYDADAGMHEGALRVEDLAVLYEEFASGSAATWRRPQQ